MGEFLDTQGNPLLPKFSTHRPNFGRKQVRSLRGIKPGLVLIKKPDNVHILVIDKPSHDETSNRWKVEVCTCDLTDNKEYTVSLSDFGVVPYPNGLWDTRNWLSRV